MILDTHFWNHKYKQQQTGWDIGYASPPIASYIDQLENRDLKILIPGCGNAYEAAYLYKKGFKNIYVLDFVKEALDNFKEKVPDFPKSHILHQDFFDLENTFDIIIEQTFFCALQPNQRKDYVHKIKSLLLPQGKLVGVLFDTEFKKPGPPFSGNLKEYSKLFSPTFDIKILEKCYNSISPRMSNELFFIFEVN
ncbi:methyltransferase domain-containing protein [Aquimarina sp. 2201CG14-23]|uniref:methyltransferase domain-containing protein n=1 Tax=Aquimarina mycalae TaxID=3040073 RepID=UPI0024782DAA|nr:methyltransferase domain-containing protein [Aquimarina sp. 2201CG14-23]MDH7444294.1 methyltransferase domain-containing protein [Aquimarina sp. 2201CG14-23]